MLEALEARTLQSGVVNIDTTGNQITINGDGLSNHLIVRQIETNDGTPVGGLSIGTGNLSQLIIDGISYTKNFQVPAAETNSPFFNKIWQVELGDGGDVLSFRDPPVAGIKINLGSGNDLVEAYLGGSSAFALTDTGGNDDLTIGSVKGNVSLLTGPGKDKIQILGDGDPGVPRVDGRVRITGKLQIQDTQGPLSLSMAYADIRKQTSIISGNSIDKMRFDFCAFSSSVIIGTHGSADSIVNSSSRFRAGGFVASGAGRDLLSGIDDGEIPAQ